MFFGHFAAALVQEAPKPAPLPPVQQQIDIVATTSGPPPRASSPLRKHKRKAIPHRSALDVAQEVEPLSGGGSGSSGGVVAEAGFEVQSRSKERRGSTPPTGSTPTHHTSNRPQRLHRGNAAAASLAAAQQQQHPSAPPAPAPEPVAAAPQPVALGAFVPKVCVQCGTMSTPMWRTVNGQTYCNADGLRLKRKLGLL